MISDNKKKFVKFVFLTVNTYDKCRMQISNLHIDTDSNRDLNDREQAILRTIINLYILNASPIGSRNLSKYLEKEIKLSPATIRNIMADLEQMDYISHPHTSAGRVPTDKGYRFFVDSLLPTEIANINDLEKLNFELDQSKGVSVLKDAGKLLGTISHYLAVVRIPHLQDLIVHRIELIQITTNRLLIVVAMDSDIVRTLTLEIPFEIHQRDLLAVTAFINDRVSGRSLSYIRQHFQYIAQEYSDASMPLVGLFVNSLDKLFHIESNSDKLHLAGTQNLLTLPEFEDVTRVRSVLELIENEEILVSVLDSSGVYDNAVKVMIGSEMNQESMEDYSFVMSSYKFGSAMGSIGLIGPRRMNYSKVISLVRAMSDLISQKSNL